jgi:hypothetical protein
MSKEFMEQVVKSILGQGLIPTSAEDCKCRNHVYYCGIYYARKPILGNK